MSALITKDKPALEINGEPQPAYGSAVLVTVCVLVTTIFSALAGWMTHIYSVPPEQISLVFWEKVSESLLSAAFIGCGVAIFLSRDRSRRVIVPLLAFMYFTFLLPTITYMAWFVWYTIVLFTS